MTVSPSQVIAFRLAAQGLGAERGLTPLDALGAGWAFQDSPPGAVAAGLSARCEALDAGWLDAALHDERSVVALYNPRTATAIVPAADVATVTAGLLPPDAESLRFVLARAIPPRGEGIEPQEALAGALPAFEEALDGVQLSRDDLHAALRERLPSDLLPWCDGCGSHHARRGLLVVAGLHGRLCIAGRAGRQPLFARSDQWIGPQAAPEAVDRDAAAAEVVRRHLRWYGPTTPELFAQWAGITPAQGARAWALVAGELAAVALEGGGSAWLLADDLPALEQAAPPSGLRLLPAGDPLLLARDRELLVADPAARRRMWAAINGPGVVLRDGAPGALWRGRKRGRRLAVEVTPLDGALPRAALTALEREAQRIAPHRGCASAAVEQTAG
jgi:Winged helix DNA-binding domain